MLNSGRRRFARRTKKGSESASWVDPELVRDEVRVEENPGMGLVFSDQAPPEIAAITPWIKDEAVFEGLVMSGHDDAIMFAFRAATGGAEMKDHGLKIEFPEFAEEIVAPVITKTALPQSGIDQDVVEHGGANRAIGDGELFGGGNGRSGQPVRFFRVNGRGESLEVAGQTGFGALWTGAMVGRGASAPEQATEQKADKHCRRLRSLSFQSFHLADGCGDQNREKSRTAMPVRFGRSWIGSNVSERASAPDST